MCAPRVAITLRDLRGVRGEDSGRVDVSETASISTGIAGRYASALFELAGTGKALASLETDVEALDAALGQSADLRTMIASPLVSREDQGRAIEAIARSMKLSALMTNTLGLMAAKRRLFVLPQFVNQLREQIAAAKGEVTAEVVSASALTATQTTKLIATLKTRVGKEVKLKATVDESLIGGLVVKLGSTMIDTSIRAKLAALKNVMKEVG
ncbi:MAG: F0F1 ATP synthase subunit delta [Cereibacter sphaeroides]|uniref:ATP synthase subunit delta n=1 Tax=Cereibacter sphaeroides TaxID=1063 RepID=A0A2W5SM55_CERSP|nr:MAG: F0F1 ATP synthase subunit delta [Cereibacter sphaeroides]